MLYKTGKAICNGIISKPDEGKRSREWARATCGVGLGTHDNFIERRRVRTIKKTERSEREARSRH